jgi:AraC family transcriptional regulator
MARARQIYTQRINRVLDHINTHIDGDLSLRRLSEIANLSQFHFHRIFHALTDETIGGYARRIRLERAASLMKASPRARITDVALEVGFAGIAEFSRAFKSHFGLTPGAWDRRSDLSDNRKNSKVLGAMTSYTAEELDGLRGKIQVQVRRLPAASFVYIRVANPYGNKRLVEAYHTLMRWIKERRMSHLDAVMLGMQQDDPGITAAEKCRYDLGFLFPTGACRDDVIAGVLRERGRHVPVAGIGTFDGKGGRKERAEFGLSVRQFPECRLATVHCRGDLAEVDRTWQFLYKNWLPRSAYDPADLPAMQLFVETPEEIGWTTFDLIAAIPLAPHRRSGDGW